MKVDTPHQLLYVEKRMNRIVLVSFALLCAGCGTAVFDPYSLAPGNPASTWSPMQGNKLVCAQFCQTLLPATFSTDALTLSDLLDVALQNNPTTKQTWASARAAAAQYGQNLSDYFPNISFNGTYTRERGTIVPIYGIPFTNIFYFTAATPDIDVTYTIFDFGQRSASARAAREALYYADWTHNQQIQTVLQTVMDDYYYYLYQMEILQGDQENLENAQAALDAANQKFSLGLAALGDVAQARTQYLQNKIALNTQQQNVTNSFAQLSTDLGLPSTVQFRLMPLPDQIAIDPMLECVDTLIAQAQTQRPALLASLANMRSKEASVDQAARALLPTATGSFSIGRYRYNGGGEERKRHFTLEFALTFPIFDGFYNWNTIRNARANLELARGQVIQTELAMIQSITTSRSNIQTAAQNLKDSSEYVQAAQLEFKIELAGYRAGTATILDVLNAQSNLANARVQRANAQQNWFISLAALAYATGSLCQIPQ